MLNQIYGTIAEAVAAAGGIEQEEAAAALTAPPKPEMGDLSFPCFPLARILRKAPPQIAAELAEEVNRQVAPHGISAEAAGPYLNFRFDKKKVSETVLTAVLGSEEILPQEGRGKTVVIDFSSPNIAKPFSMGHLRSTSIGNALSRIYRNLGWNVERVNHLGDWGTQFGKLICAFRLWGDEEQLQQQEISYLMQLYVRYNNAAKENPQLEDDARAAFKQLEDGDAEAVKLWQHFREISLREFKRIYAILNVDFDSWAGESFYNDKIEPAVAKLAEKNLLDESDGAVVVPMDEEIPPCMIRKSDGATTYAARDLAALFFRKEHYNFDKLLYVVGSPQALHFRQLFNVLDKYGATWTAACEHIPFGQVLINGEMMSTRKGNVIFLEEAINKAAGIALQKIMETEQLTAEQVTEELRERAKIIGVSSIVFFDLKNNRARDVDFNWDEILNPKGETGIYLQYAHARIHGIMRKFNDRLGIDPETVKEQLPAIQEENAYPVISELAKFPEKVRYAAETNEPSQISRYLLELASAFSTYYRENKVINPEDPQLSRERMAVVLAVKTILARGLQLLGITPLEKM